MKKKHSIILFLLTSIFLCCKKDKDVKIISVENDKPKIITKTNDKELNLTSLKEIPKEIDGCTCFFSETELNYESEQFMIITNLDSIAYISVNGNVSKLFLNERKNNENKKDDENYIEIFSNDKFKAILKFRKDNSKKNGDEVWWYKGLIDIEDRNGNTQTKNFIGKCGC